MKFQQNPCHSIHHYSTHLCVFVLGPAYNFGKFDGIFGLAFDSISVDHLKTPFHHLIQSGQLQEPVFAFYLGNQMPGELILGGTDPKHFHAPIHYIPLSSATYWEIQMDQLSTSEGTVIVNR